MLRSVVRAHPELLRAAAASANATKSVTTRTPDCNRNAREPPIHALRSDSAFRSEAQPTTRNPGTGSPAVEPGRQDLMSAHSQRTQLVALAMATAALALLSALADPQAEQTADAKGPPTAV